MLVAGISTNFTQGAAQATGRSTDMMINGDGFFVVNVGGEIQYTRAGSFDPDAQGRLVGPGGAILQGWNAVNGVVQQGGALGDVTIPLKAVSPPQPRRRPPASPATCRRPPPSATSSCATSRSTTPTAPRATSR